MKGCKLTEEDLDAMAEAEEFFRRETMTNEEKMAHEYAIENLEHCEEDETDYKRFIEKSGLSITRKEYEKMKLVMEFGEYMLEGIQKTVKQVYLKGLEAGIGRLRYCCTCKKWKECKVVSMYGICADWEIKE